jgi:hypothetical protein
LLTSAVSRQFLALVEFESKKKRAAKAASEHMEKFHDGIHNDEEALKKRLEDLSVASYVTFHVLTAASQLTIAVQRKTATSSGPSKKHMLHHAQYNLHKLIPSKRAAITHILPLCTKDPKASLQSPSTSWRCSRTPIRRP